MTSAQLREAIEAALGEVPFEPPISPEYCTAVRDALRASVPGVRLDVYHRNVEFYVEARVGDVEYRLALPLV